MAKKSLVKNSILRREFSYELNGTTLNFTLRVDNSSELRNFLSCLTQAKIDIGEILEGMKN